MTNIVTDRTLLSPMARLAKEAMAVEKIDDQNVDGLHALSDERPRARESEMSLCVLAYNIKRMISILGVPPLIAMVRE